jgi:sporulation protein YlmC with PRC-barrel domain
MLISEKQFKKIRVETQSGQYLGRLISFDLETDTGKIEKYHIKSQNSIAGLFATNLIIDKDQVINFDEQKMVVEDSLIKEKSTIKTEAEKVEELKNTEPVITSEKS